MTETLGWNPTSDRFTLSGYQVALALFDRLVADDADRGWQPYLTDTLEPSDDFTESRLAHMAVGGVAAPDVEYLLRWTLPDGEPGLPQEQNVMSLYQVWLEQEFGHARVGSPLLR